jgi:hypothetical protein
MVKNPTNLQTPKLRWFQYRLRSLLIVMTIVAVQCAVCFPMLRAWESAKKFRQIGLALHNYEGNSVRRLPVCTSTAGSRIPSNPTRRQIQAPLDAGH